MPSAVIITGKERKWSHSWDRLEPASLGEKVAIRHRAEGAERRVAKLLGEPPSVPKWWGDLFVYPSLAKRDRLCLTGLLENLI